MPTFLHNREIHDLETFLAQSPHLANTTVVGVNFSALNLIWSSIEIDNTAFLGCNFKEEDLVSLTQRGALIIPNPDHLPYDPFRSHLYRWKELFAAGLTSESVDHDIYSHFSKTRFDPDIKEALWQRIHDHAIDHALRDLLGIRVNGEMQKRCIGIMGGHSTLRSDPHYLKAALTAYHLARAGYFVASGGGPGIMEAANLGAYLSGYDLPAVYRAIELLAPAPSYSDKMHHLAALEVLEQYPKGAMSLAIPTWFYGHEPSNVFSSHIAKYFSNSIREDTLLAISLHGVIFAPGSAGTTQEIFMDAAQNHYGTFRFLSPMVFLGSEHYQKNTLIYPLLQQIAWEQPYAKLLHISDDPQEIVAWINAHPPIEMLDDR